MWTLTGVMFSYLLWSVVPPMRRIHKELAPQFLCVTSRDCRQTSFQVVHFDHIEVTMRSYCISHTTCAIFPFDSEDIRSTVVGKQTTRGRQLTHTERGTNARKLTFAGSFDCRLCFYSVHSGKRSGVLQKLLMGKLGLTVHTDTEQQAPSGWTLSSPCGGGVAAAAAFVEFKRVRCCTWTLNLLHRWWGRHCCFWKTLGNFSLSHSSQSKSIPSRPKCNSLWSVWSPFDFNLSRTITACGFLGGWILVRLQLR
jgi:hypothetical protein